MKVADGIFTIPEFRAEKCAMRLLSARVRGSAYHYGLRL